MKKSFIFFFVLIFAVSLFSTSAMAQGRVGSVNLALLYAFHPLVQTYVPDEGYFLKVANIKNFDFSRNAKKHEKMIRDINNKIYALYKKIKNQKVRKEQAQLAAYRKKRRIETDIESIKKNPANKRKKLDFSRQYKKIEKIKKDYNETIRKIDNETADMYNQAVKLNDKLKSINFYVGKENEKIVARITSEIKNAMLSVAAKHGIDIILNSSQFDTFRRLTAKKDKFRSEPYDPSNEMIPANIYKIPKEYSVANILSSHGKKNMKYAREALDYNISIYQQMMNNSDEYLKPFSTQPLDSFVVIGGEDLTAEVLAHILRKYDVEKSVINLIVMGIKTKRIY